MAGSCRREAKVERFARRRPLPATKSRPGRLSKSARVTMEESTLDALDVVAVQVSEIGRLNAKA
jgi:hypothetical protein